jgi:hypothetical protein
MGVKGRSSGKGRRAKFDGLPILVEHPLSMAKVAAYHTNSPEYEPRHREVYHDHDDCFDGKRIKQEHKEQGTGSKKRCKECIRRG